MFPTGVPPKGSTPINASDEHAPNLTECSCRQRAKQRSQSSFNPSGMQTLWMGHPSYTPENASTPMRSSDENFPSLM